MRLTAERQGIPGVLFAEDFDGLDAAEPAIAHGGEAARANDPPRIAEPEPVPPPALFDADELAAAEQRAHAAGYAEGLQAAAESAEANRVTLLAGIRQALVESGEERRALLQTQVDEVAQALLAVVSACLPVLCERHGRADLLEALHTLLPPLMGEPELHLTIHPDEEEAVAADLAAVLGKNTHLRMETSRSMGRGDAVLRWRTGNAVRDTRALRRRVFALLRQLLRSGSGMQSLEVDRHGQ